MSAVQQPSEEQKHVCELAKSGNNIMIDSVAGSGKTTTILFMAKQEPTVSHLCITYNKKLKVETRARIQKAKIQNVEAHNYHAFWYIYYDKDIRDSHIARRLKDTDNKLKPVKPFRFDRIIVDEIQDMKLVFYKLVQRIIQDNQCKDAQIILMGDRYQEIYQFNDADSRFLTLGDKLYPNSPRKWAHAKLTTSYRITREMSDFLNKCMLGSSLQAGGASSENNRITGFRSNGKKPEYIITNLFKPENIRKSLVDKIFSLLKSGGYKREEIAVLAYSVKASNRVVNLLSNSLTACKIPIYVPMSDDEELSEEVCKGKIVFSTFHQFKGLERRVIMVLGFDASIYTYYLRDELVQTVCPNILYVAATRAIDELILVHSSNNDYLPFIDQYQLARYANVREIHKLNVKPAGGSSEKRNLEISVTELVSYLPAELIDECLAQVEITQVRPPEQTGTKIPTTWKQPSGLVEVVSDVTGTAIPMYYEMLASGKCTLYDILRRTSKDITGCDIPPLDGVENLLKIATIWVSLTNKYTYKRAQIQQYNWMTIEQLEQCINRMHTLSLSPDAKYEVSARVQCKPELQNRELCGRYDYIDSEKLIEFKCTGSLDSGHMLQLCCYMYANKDRQNRMLLKLEGSEPAQESVNLANLQVGNHVFYYSKSPLVSMPVFGRILEKTEKYIVITGEMLNGKQQDPTRILISEFEDHMILNVDYIARHHPDKMPPKFHYYLYNILTGEQLEIRASSKNLAGIIGRLIEYKQHKRKTKSDAEFLEHVLA